LLYIQLIHSSFSEYFNSKIGEIKTPVNNHNTCRNSLRGGRPEDPLLGIYTLTERAERNKEMSLDTEPMKGHSIGHTQNLSENALLAKVKNNHREHTTYILLSTTYLPELLKVSSLL
jgi:hypothetical protein